MKNPGRRTVTALFAALLLASPFLAGPSRAAKEREPGDPPVIVGLAKRCEGVAAARKGGQKLYCDDGVWKSAPPSASPDAAARKPRKCEWTCHTDRNGIEICKGNGPQCNGKIPPGW